MAYTSQMADRADGWIYYYGARIYDNYLNRWLSPDSIVPDPTNPQSLNRYSYAKNNPLRYIDPTGHRDDQPTDDPTTDPNTNPNDPSANPPQENPDNPPEQCVPCTHGMDPNDPFAILNFVGFPIGEVVEVPVFTSQRVVRYLASNPIDLEASAVKRENNLSKELLA